MRRFLRVRLLLVLIALLLVPTLALPFAERLRAEWTRYWEPRVESPAPMTLADEINAAIEEATLGMGGCSVVVPAMPPD